MGKSFELLGLAGFNTFLALILSVTFLSGAQTDKIKSLNESNVKFFIEQLASVSAGEGELDSYDVTTYLMKHISEDGQFETKMQYYIYDDDADERVLEMDKMSFISHVIKGLDQMSHHETKTQIDYVSISDDMKSAKAITTNYERGLMPMEDGFGSSNMIPVLGISYCEQKIILNKEDIVQISSASCTTDINFGDNY